MCARRTIRLVIAAAAALQAVSAQAQAPRVDVELVLAVDVSWSMDPDEQRIQRQGYVAAFRDRDVIQAIREGGWGSIAVTYVEWAGRGLGQVVVPWTRIDGAEAAHAVADQLAQAPLGRATRTSISGAMEVAARLLDESPFDGARRVLDISGDGPNNQGLPVLVMRDRLVAQGITINGLPIMIKTTNPSGFPTIEGLDAYYADCVIGGTGAFLITVTHRSMFAAAIRRKLLLEIAARMPPPRPLQADAPRAYSPTDCLVGEKQWERWRGNFDDTY